MTKTDAQARTMSDVAAFVVYLVALTAPWGAVAVSGFQLVDAFIVVALAAVVLDLLGRSASLAVPKWVTVGAVAVLVVTVWHGYLSTDGKSSSPDFQTSSLLAGAKWLVALLVLPGLIVAVGQRRELIVRRIALSWLIGVVASAVVAVGDLLHVTAVNLWLLNYQNISGRQAGLGTHPNNLGVASAIALPLALMFFERRRILGCATVLVLLAGAVASGSRGAQAGFVLALILTSMATRRLRRTLLSLLTIAGLAIGVIVTLRPGVLTQISPLIRFTGPEFVARSDYERSLLRVQAQVGFETHPIAGSGLAYITDAHNIFLQLLSAGGLVLFLGFGLYVFGALRAVWRLGHAGYSLAPYLLAVVGTWMAVGFFENQLTDRFLYVPIGCIAALQMLAARASPLGLADARE